MSTRSRIEWTETTWNPTTGCDRISAGCDHCYALTLAKRLKAMGSAKYQNDGDPRTSGPGFGVTTHPTALMQPMRWREPRLVFVNSMSDLFHAKVPTAFIRQVFEVMADTPQHTYQILTKRSRRLRRIASNLDWPSNVWMGVSVENADTLDRVDDLRRVWAAVRFLSCEPLIGPLPGVDLSGIGWVIAGGESGPNARPVDPSWITGIRDACITDNVPFFFKLLCTNCGVADNGHRPSLGSPVHSIACSAADFLARALRHGGHGVADEADVHGAGLACCRRRFQRADEAVKGVDNGADPISLGRTAAAQENSQHELGLDQVVKPLSDVFLCQERLEPTRFDEELGTSVDHPKQVTNRAVVCRRQLITSPSRGFMTRLASVVHCRPNLGHEGTQEHADQANDRCCHRGSSGFMSRGGHGPRQHKSLDLIGAMAA